MEDSPESRDPASPEVDGSTQPEVSEDATASTPRGAVPPTSAAEVAPSAGGEPAGADAPPVSPSDSETPETPSDAALATSDAPKKKRRRRRRKKKGEGAESAAAEGEGTSPRDRSSERKDKKSVAPFSRFLEAHRGTRRHAFSAGEVVAGRVAGVAGPVVTVDLFGKATAYMHLGEPVGPEPLPEPPPAPAPENAMTEAAPAEPPPEVPEGVAESAAVEASGSEAGAPSGTPESAEPAEPLESPASELAGDDEATSSAGTHAAPEIEIEPEFDRDAVPRQLRVGEVVRGRIGAVAESGHIVLVNRAIDASAVTKLLQTARDARQRVDGLVYGFNRGGFDVLVRGIRLFCPASGMTLSEVQDPSALLGEWLEFGLPQRRGESAAVVVGRRSILEREARKARKARLKTLEAGQTLQGRVTQVREFGVFVDIGDGVEGMVHQTELSWQRGARPADVAKPGDEVQVQVLRIGSPEGQKEKKDKKERKERHPRVALSMRALLPDPWDEHQEALVEGSVSKGKVVSATEFGAFIELAPGIDGLLHISELGKDLRHASQATTVGEELEVVVERVDRSRRRIALSRLSTAERKALAEGEVAATDAPATKPGSIVTVVVERTEHQGVSVRVKGVLGRRGRGFIPKRELGSLSTSEHKKALAPGSELQVKIVSLDRDGGLKCSVKAKEVAEERKAVRDYRREAASQGFGTFGDLLRAKLPTADKASPPKD